MELKSRLTLLTFIGAGMLASGCQQMQQSAGASQQTTSSQQTACECTPCEQARTVTVPPATAPAKRYSPPPHRPSVVPPTPAPVRVPQVKAKGAYKGAVEMDNASKGVMQQYQR